MNCLMMVQTTLCTQFFRQAISTVSIGLNVSIRLKVSIGAKVGKLNLGNNLCNST